MPTPPIDFIDELKWRGLFHQCTDEKGLRAHLADPAKSPRRAYVGFDPTADSLTIGNLVPIMLLLHLQRAGHAPVVVMGGGTGLIGDPSGKSAERTLMTEEQVRANVEKQKPIFARVFTNAAEMERRSARVPAVVNNLDWLGELSYLEVLRDVGKHFSVNMMVQKDSVRERLRARDQGISYTEFSYLILQAYDFFFLWSAPTRDDIDWPLPEVTMQMGGSDQWGNIVAGLDLIGKGLSATAPRYKPLASGDENLAMYEHFLGFNCFGLTAPLVTKSDGGKFGKTESGSIWLTPERTSPYAFSQFWLNATDADVSKYLRMFTLMPKAEIEALEAEHAKEPGERKAQRRLAREVTTLVHGKAEAERAETAARTLFGGEVDQAAFEKLIEAMEEVPSNAIAMSKLEGEGTPILDLVVGEPLASSKREARELLQSGAISVNGKRVGIDYRVTTRDLLNGNVIALRRGKKTWLLLRAARSR